MRVVALVAMAVIAGCGGDPSVCSAIVDPSQCWPELVHTARGSVTLGTGRGGFEPMPDALPLEFGPQNGYDVAVNVRMSGFDPGNLADLLDPDNPRTRIRAFFADTNVPLNIFAVCPFRTAYKRAMAGEFDYELPAGVGILFETCWRSDRLIGKQIRLELEVMDNCGGYATDARTVTLAPPPGDYPMDTDTPGCIHDAQ